MVKNPLESEQLAAAIKFAEEFRGDREVGQFFREELLVDLRTAKSYSGVNLAGINFVVNEGPLKLQQATRFQWTTTSSRVFTHSERVQEGQPILAPSAFFERDQITDHFSLPALLEHSFDQIRNSGKALAVWSGPQPFLLFWDNVSSGSIYTPPNAKRWKEIYYQYTGLLYESVRFGPTEERVANMRLALTELGISGEWNTTQAGEYLKGKDMGMGLLVECLVGVAADAVFRRNSENRLIEDRLEVMKRKYDQLLSQNINDPVMRELIEKPVPVLLPVRVPEDQPAVAFDHYDSTFTIVRGSLGTGSDEKNLVVRHPSASYFAWRKGITAGDIDQQRPVLVHESVSKSVLERFCEIAKHDWGLDDIEVKRLNDKSTFVDDCHVPYLTNRYTLGDLKRDVKRGILTPLFNDAMNSLPHAIFKWEDWYKLAARRV